MAQLSYRVNLSAKSWPFVSTYFGRSVVVGSASHDQNFSKQLYSSEDQDKDIGIPQMYYMHNCMPTSQGIQSIGYIPTVPAVPFVEEFTEIFTLYYSQGAAYFTCLPNGRCFVCQFGASPQWLEINTIPGISGRMISVVNISGNSYIFFSGLGCYKFFPGALTLVGQILNGLDVTKVVGIVGAVGYMIAYSTDSIAWSSTEDPTDFTPSLITGAGGGGVEHARGPIVFCVPSSAGLTITTAVNCVNAPFTGNARFPFIFNAVAGAGGITSRAVVAQDISASEFYAYSTAGLQKLVSSSAALIYTEVTDFISGKVFEDFDELTNTFSITKVETMKKALNVIANRYLILSYGVEELTHALVLDMGAKRWGKLKITHVECFEYLLKPAEQTEVSRQSIGFFKKSGEVVRADFDSEDTVIPHNGVLILGKYQYVRARMLTLDETVVENVRDVSKFSIQNSYSLRGKSIDSTSTGYLHNVDGEACSYRFRDTAMNHSLLLKGSFYAVSLQLKFHIHGAR